VGETQGCRAVLDVGSDRDTVKFVEPQGARHDVGNDIGGSYRVLEADDVVGRGDAPAVMRVGPPAILSW
jgi:hypothetical protein